MALLAVPLDLDGEHGSLAPFTAFDALADEAEFAFLVEMDHCIHERHEFRLLCLRYLASRGWTLFGEELDWQTGDRIDRYLVTGDESLLEPVDDREELMHVRLRRVLRDRPGASVTPARIDDSESA